MRRPERFSVGAVDDVRLRVEHAEGIPQVDEVLGDWGRDVDDVFQRSVYGGDVGEHDKQLTHRHAAVEDEQSAITDHQSSADCREHVDGQREQSLADSNVDSRIKCLATLCDITVLLVSLPTERSDHLEHCHRLIHDGHESAFHVPNAEQTRLYALGVVPGRIDQEWHDYQ